MPAKKKSPVRATLTQKPRVVAQKVPVAQPATTQSVPQVSETSAQSPSGISASTSAQLQTSPPIAPPPSAVDLEESLDVDEILDSNPEESYLDRANTAIFAGGIILAASIIIISIVVYLIYLRAPQVAQQKKSTTITATPTPTPSFDPSHFSFEVYNASGVPGAASKAALDLKAKGYEVVTVGNMKNTPLTQIYIEQAVAPYDRSMLLADITTLFGVSSSSGDLTNTTASARLIIGAK